VPCRSSPVKTSSTVRAKTRVRSECSSIRSLMTQKSPFKTLLHRKRVLCSLWISNRFWIISSTRPPSLTFTFHRWREVIFKNFKRRTRPFRSALATMEILWRRIGEEHYSCTLIKSKSISSTGAHTKLSTLMWKVSTIRATLRRTICISKTGGRA